VDVPANSWCYFTPPDSRRQLRADLFLQRHKVAGGGDDDDAPNGPVPLEQKIEAM